MNDTECDGIVFRKRSKASKLMALRDISKTSRVTITRNLVFWEPDIWVMFPAITEQLKNLNILTPIGYQLVWKMLVSPDCT